MPRDSRNRLSTEVGWFVWGVFLQKPTGFCDETMIMTVDTSPTTRITRRHVVGGAGTLVGAVLSLLSLSGTAQAQDRDRDRDRTRDRDQERVQNQDREQLQNQDKLRAQGKTHSQIGVVRGSKGGRGH